MDEEIRTLIEAQAKEIRKLKDDRRSVESRMRLLVTNLPLGLLLLDQQQRIEAANEKAVEFFEYTSSEMSRLRIDSLFPERMSFEPTDKPLRVMGRRKSGVTFAAEIFVNILQIEEEERLFVSVQDITERVQLEQLKRDLISIVSHDLRNPLSSVLLALEMVGSEMFGTLSERGHACVGRAASVTEYLISLVVNLLDSEKIDRGGIELDLCETTTGAIVRKAIDTIPKEDYVEIETEFTDDGITVDRDRIVQVLINLVTNAMKFSPNNSKIIVKASVEGADAKFQVIDEGPGIPEDMQSVIFERYRQLQQQPAADSKRKGFGLGLAICKALVQAHNGTIWVESDGQNGSKFCFSVPVSPK